MSFAPSLDDQDCLTTTEAAALVGRAQSAVRAAIKPPAGFRRDGRNYMSHADLLAWDRAPDGRSGPACPPTRTPPNCCANASPHHRAGRTQASSIPGNIRKHLAILATPGRVECRPNGQWDASPRS